MRRNEYGRSRNRAGMAVAKLALIILVVLTAAPLAAGASKKDKGEDGNYYPQELTGVYQHSYDEVFQASQEAIERLGWFVTDNDKDKGTISGKKNTSASDTQRFIFRIHIESLNTKPETKITINAHWNKKGNYIREPSTREFEEKLATMLQKVLATYH